MFLALPSKETFVCYFLHYFVNMCQIPAKPKVLKIYKVTFSSHFCWISDLNSHSISSHTFQPVNKFPFERDFAKLKRILHRPKRIWSTR